MGINAQTSVPKFTAGDTLTAANTNLLSNGIPVFGGTALRDAAFGGSGEKVLAEGQYAYLEDTNTTQYYDGAAWQPVGVSPGLVLIQDTVFTSTATWTLDNIFSSTYDNYRIDINWSALTSTASYALLQLRVGGVAATGSNYNYAMVESNSSAANNRYATGVTGVPAIELGGGSDAVVGSSTFTVFKPNIAQVTSFTGQYIGLSSGLRGVPVQAYHSLATSYDGIQIANGSTASGTVYVYGLAK